mgnify:CR=1 FL=1
MLQIKNVLFKVLCVIGLTCLIFSIAACELSIVAEDGSDGKSAYQIWLDNGNTGSESDFLNWLKGADGKNGTNGNDGKSAYQIWLDNGNTGTIDEWLESLNGKDLTYCNHAWSDFAVEIAPSCSSIGCNIRTCFTCNTKERQIIPALKHQWKLYETLQEKTCLQDGITYRYCDVCGVMQLNLDKAIGHALVHHEAKQVTCTQIGWDEYDTCENCNYTTYSEIEIIPHKIEDHICTMCEQVFPSEGLTFTSNNDGTCTLTGIGTCKDSYLYIPELSPGGSKVTAIKSDAFNNCTNIIKLTIQAKVESVGLRAFANCSNLTTLNWNAVKCTSAGGQYGNVFANCSKLKDVFFGNNIESIPDYLLAGCNGLTNIDIPDNVLSMGDYVFYNCNALASVTIGRGVTSIGKGIFSNCNSLSNISVSSNNTHYHSSGNCIIETESKKLSSGCKDSLIPTDGSVTSIGDYAFYNCSALKGVTIPDSVTSIGINAFGNCTGFTHITLPNGVRIIENWAFGDCRNLRSIDIPVSVTNIGDYVFTSCDSLMQINYGGKKSSWYAIKKGYYWAYDTLNFGIDCTDGSLTKS